MRGIKPDPCNKLEHMNTYGPIRSVTSITEKNTHENGSGLKLHNQFHISDHQPVSSMSPSHHDSSLYRSGLRL